ncbi:hypothetical protein WR25_04363 [Diploscapter pachys]|uniref:Uncharacterized protein n=1 Tax=Diploscapter pachys TaxID=2018661 RepID=A0A2A2LYN7_9BILA|nr:hypothetical protein WR25_04363 [Diploscapter pachys]
MPLSSRCYRRLLACLFQSLVFVSFILSLVISSSQARPQQEVKDIIKNLVEKDPAMAARLEQLLATEAFLDYDANGRLYNLQRLG